MTNVLLTNKPILEACTSLVYFCGAVYIQGPKVEKLSPAAVPGLQIIQHSPAWSEYPFDLRLVE